MLTAYHNIKELLLESAQLSQFTDELHHFMRSYGCSTLLYLAVKKCAKIYKNYKQLAPTLAAQILPC